MNALALFAFGILVIPHFLIFIYAIIHLVIYGK